MQFLLERIGDGFIWITSIVAGAATLFGAYKAGIGAAVSTRAKAILGTWHWYGYFQTLDGPAFYRELITVSRCRWRPWRLKLSAVPVGSDDVTKYEGEVTVTPPFVYVTCWEPVFGDRTFEIYRWQMGLDHAAHMLIGIHLGRSYEESINSASAFVMCRSHLDKSASNTKEAELETEEREFKKLIKKHFELESKTYQILLK